MTRTSDHGSGAEVPAAAGARKRLREQEPDLFERSVTWWLRAYPERWRSVRGDEVIDVLRDMAGPGARWLSLREGLGLVRAGWATRWRTGPPLGVRWRYRWSMTRPIDRRYREWARDDIAGRFFLTRQWWWRTSPVLLSQAWLQWQNPEPRLIAAWALLMVAVPVTDVLHLDRGREPAVRLHLVPGRGERPVAGGFVEVRVGRPRVRAVPGLALIVGVAGVAVLAGVVGLLAAPGYADVQPCGRGCWTVVPVPPRAAAWLVGAGVAALLGVAAAHVCRRRLVRLVPLRPEQPGRRLVTASPGASVVAVLAVVVLLLAGWAEATGRVPALVGPMTLVLGAAALPALVGCLWSARRGPADLTVVDVVRIAGRNVQPLVDEPLPWAARSFGEPHGLAG